MNVKGVGQKLVQNLVYFKQENRSESTARRPVAPRSRRNSTKGGGAGVGGPAPANVNANGMRASGKTAAKEAGPSVVRKNLTLRAQESCRTALGRYDAEDLERIKLRAEGIPFECGSIISNVLKKMPVTVPPTHPRGNTSVDWDEFFMSENFKAEVTKIKTDYQQSNTLLHPKICDLGGGMNFMSFRRINKADENKFRKMVIEENVGLIVDLNPSRIFYKLTDKSMLRFPSKRRSKSAMSVHAAIECVESAWTNVPALHMKTMSFKNFDSNASTVYEIPRLHFKGAGERSSGGMSAQRLIALADRIEKLNPDSDSSRPVIFLNDTEDVSNEMLMTFIAARRTMRADPDTSNDLTALTLAKHLVQAVFYARYSLGLNFFEFADAPIFVLVQALHSSLMQHQETAEARPVIVAADSCADSSSIDGGSTKRADSATVACEKLDTGNAKRLPSFMHRVRGGLARIKKTFSQPSGKISAMPAKVLEVLPTKTSGSSDDASLTLPGSKVGSRDDGSSIDARSSGPSSPGTQAQPSSAVDVSPGKSEKSSPDRNKIEPPDVPKPSGSPAKGLKPGSSTMWQRLKTRFSSKPPQQTVELTEVGNNTSGVICPEKTVVKVPIIEQGVERSAPLHANTIRFSGPHSEIAPADAPPVPVRTAIAGQSPQAFNLSERFLLHAIKSGNGLFQFVSTDAHREGLEGKEVRRESPLISQVLEQWKDSQRTDSPMILGGTHKITGVDKLPIDGSNTDWRRLAVHVETLGNPVEKKTVVLTHAGLRFQDRVLKKAEIERADELICSHLELVKKGSANPGSVRDPMVVSYSGVGRNATLICYREVKARMANDWSIEQLDAVLEKVIDKGREDRGPLFMHSEAQLAELRNALIDRLPVKGSSSR